MSALEGVVETQVDCRCSTPTKLWPGEHCPTCRAFVPRFEKPRKGRPESVRVVYDELSRVTEALYEEIRRRVPKDTGALRDSVGVGSDERFRCVVESLETRVVKRKTPELLDSKGKTGDSGGRK